ncbi:MAG: DNA-binding protein [Bdellovibrionaceae bacterium]|nr:DNA-binding protein [Bdellovibrio sp.]
MKTHCVRLNPQDDLKIKIIELCKASGIQAACVISAVGSLQHLKLRLANSQTVLEKSEKFEVLSLNGTVSIDGVHLHAMVSDSNGQTWGGHLLDGNIIYTTCELVVLEIDGFKMGREFDAATGFKELKITKLD